MYFSYPFKLYLIYYKIIDISYNIYVFNSLFKKNSLKKKKIMKIEVCFDSFVKEFRLDSR